MRKFCFFDFLEIKKSLNLESNENIVNELDWAQDIN